MENTLIAVVGPTAIGKTPWAICLAKHYKTEIVSADSRQFYKEMAIGTAVPTKEEQLEVTHHFIQHRSIKEPWSVGDFEGAALLLLNQLFKQYRIVVAVGGSGLYLQALTEGLDHFPDVDPSIRKELQNECDAKGLAYLQRELEMVDPKYYEVVDLQNPQRVMRALEIFRGSGKPYSTYLNKPKAKRQFRTLYLGVMADRELIYKRIENRVDQMMESGLLEEVRPLLKYKDFLALQTVGYQELFKYLEGLCELEQAVEEIKKNTRRYAKRQMTWFRRNKDILWIDHEANFPEVLKMIEAKLKMNNHE